MILRPISEVSCIETSNNAFLPLSMNTITHINVEDCQLTLFVKQPNVVFFFFLPNRQNHVSMSERQDIRKRRRAKDDCTSSNKTPRR